MRSSCGLALLVLLAAQQKAWPWLLTPPVRPAARDQPAPDAPAAPTQPAPNPEAPPGGPESTSRHPPLSLASILPDAVPVRWPVPLNPAALEERVGRCEGTTARGPLNPAATDAPTDAVDVPPPWRCAPRLPFELSPVGVADGLPIRDPAVRTVLLRTGPPRA